MTVKGRTKIQNVAKRKAYSSKHTKESITRVLSIRPKSGPDSKKTPYRLDSIVLNMSIYEIFPHFLD